MTDFEKRIGYTFKNKEYLKTALSHSSYAYEKHVESNERLEFLGDSVLSLIVSEKLFLTHSKDDEGDLSKIRASLVCENGLFELSKKIDLAKEIRLGRGEEMGGGRNRPSVISDAFEAVLAAIFLDSDFYTAKKWLLGLMDDEFKHLPDKGKLGDYKTALQEHTQKGTKGKVTYTKISEDGPDHNKHFVCAVQVDGKEIARGDGRTKKEAEQNAAKRALEIL
ncbi:MAG: ribonuclease III [Clostridia bacterium]|nr:ribonuclease III [Clostridia bacterium]